MKFLVYTYAIGGSALRVLFYIGITFFSASFLQADIYEWTDAAGVKHFANYTPPADARIITITKEVPYDEAADKARMEHERRERLRAERQALAEREADLERREAEAQRRLAEAERQARETLRKAEDLLDAVDDERYFDRNYGFYGYYPGCFRPSCYGHWYYRSQNGSIYFKKPYNVKPYKHPPYSRGHYKHPRLSPAGRNFHKKRHYTRSSPPEHYRRANGRRHAVRSWGAKPFEHRRSVRISSGFRSY